MITTLKTKSKYEIECVKLHDGNENLIAVWHQLLSNSSSPEKIYQTPDFFEFLQKTNDGQDHIELLSIKLVETGEIIGIVPIRFRKLPFEFCFGSKTLAAPKMQVIVLLGTIPLLQMVPHLFEDLIRYLFEKFPLCNGISLPALPANSDFRSYIRNSSILRDQCRIHVLHGWRECHVIPLVNDFEKYLQQFSSKKRFNLKRQVRLLREHGGGELRLDRIEYPEQVLDLIKARNAVASIDAISNSSTERVLIGLAQQRLLHSYILMSGERPYAVILATRSEQVLHIHNIFYPEDLARMSVGVSILHLAIEDLTTNFEFLSIDLGYSNPAHNHQSSNSIEIRGHMLLLRKTWRNRFLCFTHQCYVKQLELLKNIMENQRRRIRNSKKSVSGN
ncbi:MAG: GNAT family N-acetyltransferase [Undibacterium sp.]|nr:GNAT family N-acetyltransferase [Undibacterium sp.]